MTTSIDGEGVDLTEVDLSNKNPSPTDDNKIYKHNGKGTITLVDGTTTSEDNYYAWDEPQGAWRRLAASENPNFDSALIRDDGKLKFGTDSDYSIRYDSSKDKLVVQDEVNGVDGFQISRNGLVEIPNGSLTVDDTGASVISLFDDSDRPAIRLERTDSITNGADLGQIRWRALDDGGNEENYVFTRATAVDVTDTSEDSKWELFTYKNGSRLVSLNVESHDVKIPNGDLVASGNWITQNGNGFRGGASTTRLRTHDSASTDELLLQSFDGTSFSTNVRITDAITEISNGDFELLGGNLNTRDGGSLLLEADDSAVTDGGAVNAPGFTSRGFYDSDTSTSVNATAEDFNIAHLVSYNGGSGFSTVDFRVDGTDVMRFQDTNNIQINTALKFPGNDPIRNSQNELVIDFDNASTRIYSDGAKAITADSSQDVSLPNGVLDVSTDGTSTTPAIQLGGNGAGFFVDSNGEVNVVDEAGNTTVIS